MISTKLMKSKQFDAQFEEKIWKFDRWRDHNAHRQTPPIMQQKLSKFENVSNVINSHGNTHEFLSQYAKELIQNGHLEYCTEKAPKNCVVKQISKLDKISLFQLNRAEGKCLKIIPFSSKSQEITEKIQEIRWFNYVSTCIQIYTQKKAKKSSAPTALFSVDIVGQSLYKLAISENIDLMIEIQCSRKCETALNQKSLKSKGRFVFCLNGQMKTFKDKNWCLSPCIILRKNDSEFDFGTDTMKHSSISLRLFKNDDNFGEINYVQVQWLDCKNGNVTQSTRYNVRKEYKKLVEAKQINDNKGEIQMSLPLSPTKFPSPIEPEYINNMRIQPKLNVYQRTSSLVIDQNGKNNKRQRVSDVCDNGNTNNYSTLPSIPVQTIPLQTLNTQNNFPAVVSNINNYNNIHYDIPSFPVQSSDYQYDPTSISSATAFDTMSSNNVSHNNVQSSNNNNYNGYIAEAYCKCTKYLFYTVH